MRKSNLERLREKHREAVPTVETDLDGLFRMLLGGPFTPTQKSFIYDSTRLKAFMGHIGSAKTSTIVAAGLARSLLQPGSKGLIARYDYNDLMDTTALRAEEMMQRLPKGILVDRDKSPPMKWWIASAVPDGDPSQITFMGLKDTLGSYEFNWAIVDEATEVDEKRVHEINTRLRYKGGDYTVMLAFNPPDKHHWLYTACTGKDFQDRSVSTPWMKMFKPVPKENQLNLPSDYYDVVAKSLPDDMKQRLIEGEWGTTFEGQPVYREFKRSIHVRDLQYIPGHVLFRFWDFGYNRPACLWAQLDFEGRLLVLRECLGDKLEAVAFARKVKALTATYYPDVTEVIDYGDPAVQQKKDTGQTLAALIQEGITVRYRSSTIEYGLTLIRRLLEQLIAGEPAIQFDRRYCPILIAGMAGGYRMDKHGEKPHKDGYYDHENDCIRYGIVNLFGGQMTAARPLIPFKLPESVSYDPHFDPINR